MNNKETITSTKTDNLEGKVASVELSDKIIVSTPIFIIFAEYMGYISELSKMVENWCDGKVPEIHMQKFIEIEASTIFRQMKKDYDLETIKYYYNSYYPLILEEYEEKLKEILNNK